MTRDELRQVHEGVTSDEPTIYFEKLTSEEVKALKAKVKTKRARDDSDNTLAQAPAPKRACSSSHSSSPSASASSVSSSDVNCTDANANGHLSTESSALSVGPNTPDEGILFYDPTELAAFDKGTSDLTMQEFLNTPSSATS